MNLDVFDFNEDDDVPDLRPSSPPEHLPDHLPWIDEEEAARGAEMVKRIKQEARRRREEAAYIYSGQGSSKSTANSGNRLTNVKMRADSTSETTIQPDSSISHTSVSHEKVKKEEPLEMPSNTPTNGNGVKRRTSVTAQAEPPGIKKKRSRYEWRTEEERLKYNAYMKIKMQEYMARLKAYGVKRMSDLTPEQKAILDVDSGHAKRGTNTSRKKRAASPSPAKPKSSRISNESRPARRNSSVGSNTVPSHLSKSSAVPEKMQSITGRGESQARQGGQNGRDRSASRDGSPPTRGSTPEDEKVKEESSSGGPTSRAPSASRDVAITASHSASRSPTPLPRGDGPARGRSNTPTSRVPSASSDAVITAHRSTSRSSSPITHTITPVTKREPTPFPRGQTSQASSTSSDASEQRGSPLIRSTTPARAKTPASRSPSSSRNIVKPFRRSVSRSTSPMTISTIPARAKTPISRTPSPSPDVTKLPHNIVSRDDSPPIRGTTPVRAMTPPSLRDRNPSPASTIPYRARLRSASRASSRATTPARAKTPSNGRAHSPSPVPYRARLRSASRATSPISRSNTPAPGKGKTPNNRPTASRPASRAASVVSTKVKTYPSRRPKPPVTQQTSSTGRGRGRPPSALGGPSKTGSRSASRAGPPTSRGGIPARPKTPTGRGRGRPPSAMSMGPSKTAGSRSGSRAGSPASRGATPARPKTPTTGRKRGRPPKARSMVGSRPVSRAEMTSRGGTPARAKTPSTGKDDGRGSRVPSMSQHDTDTRSNCASPVVDPISRDTTPEAKMPIRSRNSSRTRSVGPQGQNRPTRTQSKPKVYSPTMGKPHTKVIKHKPLSEEAKEEMRKEDLQWLKECGLHIPGKKYRLAPFGTVYEFAIRDYVKYIDEAADETEKDWKERSNECDGKYYDDFIVGCTAYEGVWDEAEEPREVKFLSKYRDFPVAYWLDYKTKTGRLLFSEIRAIQEWRAREAALSKVRVEIRKECEAAGQDFNVMYPEVFLPMPKRCGYAKDPICMRRTRLRALEATINDILTRCGLPPIVLENWTGVDDRKESIYNFVWTNYILPSTRVSKAIRDCEQTLIQSCVANCTCNVVLDGQSKSDAEYTCKCQRMICEQMENSAVECFDECRCTVDRCPSRVLQRGRQHPVLIFRHPTKGWTMRALERMPEGTFVGERAGEILTAWENEELDEQAYSIELPNVMVDLAKESNFDAREEPMVTGRWKKEEEEEEDGYHHRAFVNTALRKGNETRFASHSCLPNMRIECRYLERNDWSYNHFGFFTTKDVEIGQELTWNYHGQRLEDARKDGKPFKSEIIENCKCGSGNDCMIIKWTQEDIDADQIKQLEEADKDEDERGYDSFSDDDDEFSDEEKERRAEVNRENRLMKKAQKKKAEAKQNDAVEASTSGL